MSRTTSVKFIDEEAADGRVKLIMCRMSDAMIIYQSRPFFLGYVSEWWLGEPMTKIQKIASGEPRFHHSLHVHLDASSPALVFFTLPTIMLG